MDLRIEAMKLTVRQYCSRAAERRELLDQRGQFDEPDLTATLLAEIAEYERCIAWLDRQIQNALTQQEWPVG